MGSWREPCLNELTKECVELVPRVLRVASGEKPTSLSQPPEVEATNTDNDIKYDRNKDKVYQGSAWSIRILMHNLHVGNMS